MLERRTALDDGQAPFAEQRAAKVTEAFWKEQEAKTKKVLFTSEQLLINNMIVVDIIRIIKFDITRRIFL